MDIYRHEFDRLKKIPYRPCPDQKTWKHKCGELGSCQRAVVLSSAQSAVVSYLRSFVHSQLADCANRQSAQYRSDDHSEFGCPGRQDPQIESSMPASGIVHGPVDQCAIEAWLLDIESGLYLLTIACTYCSLPRSLGLRDYDQIRRSCFGRGD